MTIHTIKLSEITGNSNPRKTFNQKSIEQMAQSIKQDGIISNLVVIKNDNGYTVIAGGRRLRSLHHLLELNEIDNNYPVPVMIKEEQAENDNLRIGLVENMQRESMHPLEEADAFFTLTKEGVNLEEVAAQSGVSLNTIKRRLLLINLSDESKALYREGEINLSQAEALAMGNAEEQQAIIKRMNSWNRMDADDIRNAILGSKPSVPIALFDKEKYTGSFTSDLFAEDESTYFDDVELFNELQDEAVDQLVQEYATSKKYVDWVEINRENYFSQYDYREVEEGENGGVIIHYRMDGKVEIHEGLVKRENTKILANETPKERPEFSKKAYGYFAKHKTILVQNEIATNARKALEIDIIQRLKYNYEVKVKFHKALTLHDEVTPENRALVDLLKQIENHLEPLGFQCQNEWDSHSKLDYTTLYEALKALNDYELNHVFSVLVALSFGQEIQEGEESKDSIFHQVARDVDVDIRDGWTPDEEYFKLHKKDQLLEIAEACGASTGKQLYKLKRKDLIAELVAYYANPEPLQNESQEALKASYCPRLMQFEAEESEA